MHTGETLAGSGIAGVDGGQLRLLALAGLASLVLHALVLYALPILKESARAPARPLTARLAQQAPAAPPKTAPPLAPSPRAAVPDKTALRLAARARSLAARARTEPPPLAARPP